MTTATCYYEVRYIISGVAEPLAARGGCQIRRPSILDFGTWRDCLSQS